MFLQLRHGQTKRKVRPPFLWVKLALSSYDQYKFLHRPPRAPAHIPLNAKRVFPIINQLQPS